MAALDDLRRALRLPATMPYILGAAEIVVSYTPRAVADGVVEDRLESIEMMLDDLRALLAAGFCAYRFGKGLEVTAEAAMSREGDAIGIRLAHPGLHCNALLALLRTLHAMHDPDPEAMAVLQEEGAATPGPVPRFPDLVSAITVSGLADAEGAGEGAFDPASALPFHQAAGITGAPPDTALVEASRLVAAPAPAGLALDPDEEDAYLSIAMLSAFVPLGAAPAHEPGEEEIFIRPGEGGGAEIVVDHYAGELPFLLELLNMVSGGHVHALHIRAER